MTGTIMMRRSKNITHTPRHPGSSIKEQNKELNTRCRTASFGGNLSKMWLADCLWIFSNSSTNPCFGNKRINSCCGDIFRRGIFCWVFKIPLVWQHIIKESREILATLWPSDDKFCLCAMCWEINPKNNKALTIQINTDTFLTRCK